MAAKRVCSVPWVGPAAAQSGSSPEPGGGGHSAEPPPWPYGSPPAAAAHWPPPAPAPPPSPGNATCKLQHVDQHKDTEDVLYIRQVCTRLTWMTAFLSARGRFLASLSASSHSLITWVQEKEGKTLITLINLLYLSTCFITGWFYTWVKHLIALCGTDRIFSRLSKWRKIWHFTWLWNDNIWAEGSVYQILAVWVNNPFRLRMLIRGSICFLNHRGAIYQVKMQYDKNLRFLFLFGQLHLPSQMTVHPTSVPSSLTHWVVSLNQGFTKDMT